VFAGRNHWVDIQTKTFTNWLNEHLNKQQVWEHVCTHNSTLQLHCAHVASDLCDGVLLVRLVEALRRRPCTGRLYTHAPTELQCMMNVQMAIDALRDDGLKLVNIGECTEFEHIHFTPPPQMLQVVKTLSAVITNSYSASYGA
jgi:hypothetical protein